MDTAKTTPRKWRRENDSNQDETGKTTPLRAGNDTARSACYVSGFWRRKIEPTLQRSGGSFDRIALDNVPISGHSPRLRSTFISVPQATLPSFRGESSHNSTLKPARSSLGVVLGTAPFSRCSKPSHLDGTYCSAVLFSCFPLSV